ncbi:MAG: erythromycin esterase family protein, partial [Polyangiaceae bacterium]
LVSSKVGVHGLDLYSLFTSMNAVLDYLDRVDPAAADVARVRYGRLTPWQKDPAAYGLAVLNGKYQSSESDVLAMLRDMLEKRAAYAESDPKRFFDATQNARVVAAAEQYYRAMYYGAADSWNLRDRHMFETLESLFTLHGPTAKGIVWAHNSHVGDARATEMALHGELNIGQLCRQRFGDGACLVGFGTDHGSVVAAADWGEPMQTMRVRAAHRRSYEHVFHESGVAAFLLSLRSPRRRAVRDELLAGRLERAIGVVYRPETEIASHYLEARLPEQFDEYIWFDETSAILPLLGEMRPTAGLAETYPFGL